MKEQKSSILIVELVFLYVLLPISFCFSYPIYIKLGIGVLSFLYLMIFLYRTNYPFIKNPFYNYSKNIGLQVVYNLTGLILITTAYLGLTKPDILFNIVLLKPKMWIAFLFIYSFVSVIPQEIVYRSFFFKRYKSLFTNKKLFIFSNALLFSLGHIFFNNLFVCLITFIGGYIFAYTYLKTKSLVWVSFEHAIYGCWLFTVGFGDILGFPSP